MEHAVLSKMLYRGSENDTVRLTYQLLESIDMHTHFELQDLC